MNPRPPRTYPNGPTGWISPGGYVPCYPERESESYDTNWVNDDEDDFDDDDFEDDEDDVDDDFEESRFNEDTFEEAFGEDAFDEDYFEED